MKEDTDRFKDCLEAYLELRSKKDEEFAKHYNKEGKSLDECTKYVINKVKESKRSGFSSGEIYSLAEEYYIKDKVPAQKGCSCRIVVDQVSEEEKEALRQEAKETFIKSELDKLKEQNKPKSKKTNDSGQLSLF